MTNPKEAPREALPEPLKVVADRIYAAIDDHRNSTYCWQGNIEGAYEQAVAQHGAEGVAKVEAILSAALESERQAHAAEVERLRGDAEWISVADRMPPPITTVIAHGRQYGDHGRHPKVYTTYTGTRVRETVEDEEITHWMPLPQAPVSAIDQAIARGKT